MKLYQSATEVQWEWMFVRCGWVICRCRWVNKVQHLIWEQRRNDFFFRRQVRPGKAPGLSIDWRKTCRAGLCCFSWRSSRNHYPFLPGRPFYIWKSEINPVTNHFPQTTHSRLANIYSHWTWEREHFTFIWDKSISLKISWLQSQALLFGNIIPLVRYSCP